MSRDFTKTLFGDGGHYSIMALGDEDGMAKLREIFDGDVDYTMNWLVCSTSGIHGSYETLDQMFSKDREMHLREEDCADGCFDARGNYVRDVITVLVVQPRIVRTWYGSIWITRDDVAWLRDVVAKSLKGIARTQRKNMPKRRKAVRR